MPAPEGQFEFQMSVTIEHSDIDQLGHVNNVVYLRWVQEVATAHWFAAASEEHKESIIWVVLRHEIDYKRAAKLEDEVVLHTWVGKGAGLRFERFVDIRRNDGTLLAHTRTIWCPLDARTMRPRRLDASLHDRFKQPPL